MYIKFGSSFAVLPMTFVDSHVRASKKVNINYFVDLSLNRDGSIAEGQCDCAEGSGQHTTCKNIVIVLLALVDHSMNVPVMTYVSSTQKLQSFHTCKPLPGSPIIARDRPINLKQKRSRDPRPASCRNDPRYQHLFRNVVMVDEKTCEMPFFFFQAFKGKCGTQG
ncbi:hypothetical protein PoB_006676800 [Plakobranchus ocellatus]|uniref:SWIM-type domain-containing protein n=1 Tax=Plakobranchus ocellatus TaxID=259542 RepID=A0AAV4D7X8_9GAST|nr:hypothetical protein PoB_006676800 [Plakobranchus ocellatus]